MYTKFDHRSPDQLTTSSQFGSSSVNIPAQMNGIKFCFRDFCIRDFVRINILSQKSHKMVLPVLNLRFRPLVFARGEFSVFDFDDPTISHTAAPTCQSICSVNYT